MENLPSELLAHIAKFGGTSVVDQWVQGWGTNSRRLRDLLYLRCASIVRGCPKLIDLLWHLDCDRHVDGQNVDDLLALLKDRGKGNPDQYVEVDVL